MLHSVLNASGDAVWNLPTPFILHSIDVQAEAAYAATQELKIEINGDKVWSAKLTDSQNFEFTGHPIAKNQDDVVEITLSKDVNSDAVFNVEYN